MYKVLFTGCTFNEVKILELLKQAGLAIIPASSDLTESELKEALQDCDAVIVNGNEYYTSDVLSNCPKLKVIQFFGIGYEKCVEVETANKYRKIISNTPKVNSYSVAEFALGLIFALNQKILQYDQETRTGIWEEKTFFDLKNKTVGIVGMGNIGTHFANIVYNAFHTNILFCDIVDKADQEKAFNTKATSLNNLLKESDIVSLHVPLNNDTQNMINEEKLSLMKKDAYLINTARAEVVDANALFLALKNNKIAGCAFDGFYKEPVDLNSNEAKLLTLPIGKFVLTPHTGYNATDAIGRMEKMCIENLLHIFNNQECKGIVNKYFSNEL
ncbi:MAG: NAD(P)-dependent oxidoreductase [Candidatus Berkelbacteria bacterium]